jgi:citrate synthase
VSNVDQRRFVNQPFPADGAFLTGPEAAALLGVRRETLYAYASRGLVTSVPGPAGRGRLYAREDLERLRARSQARAGHGAVAAGALRWGEPVLETAISEIGADGPRYRGRSAAMLAAEGAPFERVAERLWGEAGREGDGAWPAPRLGVDPARLARLLPIGAPPLAALSLAVAVMGARDEARFLASDAAELDRARSIVARMAALVGLGRAPELAREAAGAGRVARIMLASLGARATARAKSAVDVALTLSADHELNPSTFAVRVAASTGADLYACVSAGLATLSGPAHGGACDRVEALVAEVGRPERARAVVAERARRGEPVPGFGHPLYAGGDPRAPPLLEAARRVARRGSALPVVLAIAEAMRGAGRGEPTIDLGLVALAAALELPAGAAAGLFAVGRSAGWIAHALEQRRAGFVLRPRARYVGA